MEPCEECVAANRKAKLIGMGAGALVGAGVVFVLLRYVAK